MFMYKVWKSNREGSSIRMRETEREKVSNASSMFGALLDDTFGCCCIMRRGCKLCHEIRYWLVIVCVRA